MHQATEYDESIDCSLGGRQSLSREDTMESLLSSPDLDSAIWSITLNVGPQNMGLVLRIWTFDLEHHGGTFIFSRPESVIWTFERNFSSELLLQHHRNQEDGNVVVQVNKDDTTQSVLCTNPEPHIWSWKFYLIPERIPPHWALVGGAAWNLERWRLARFSQVTIFWSINLAPT